MFCVQLSPANACKKSICGVWSHLIAHLICLVVDSLMYLAFMKRTWRSNLKTESKQSYYLTMRSLQTSPRLYSRTAVCVLMDQIQCFQWFGTRTSNTRERPAQELTIQSNWITEADLENLLLMLRSGLLPCLTAILRVPGFRPRWKPHPGHALLAVVCNASGTYSKYDSFQCGAFKHTFFRTRSDASIRKSSNLVRVFDAFGKNYNVSVDLLKELKLLLMCILHLRPFFKHVFFPRTPYNVWEARSKSQFRHRGVKLDKIDKK